jgi:ornithine cyclodeaminase/alanine dehydrogenase-like protein (mu-crystallin family)
MLALSRADLRQLVPMREAVELMKVAFADLSAGRAQSPLRTVLSVPEHAGDSLYMPAYVPGGQALGVKVVSVFRKNPAKGLPLIHALVVIVDPETGAPLAILDGAYLTALRTGAVSGAATDLLARPESKTLVVIGAGVQGVTQAAAVCAVRPIERIVAVDASEAALSRYREAIGRDWPDLSDRLETAPDPAVVAEADVVCTATTSKTPVFDDARIRPGTHVNAVGAFTPDMQELPAATVVRATVVVDATEAALHEAGDLIIPLRDGLVPHSHFERELGLVVSGVAPGRTSADEITLFKSVGNAVQDVVVGRRAVDRARERGIGTTIELG